MSHWRAVGLALLVTFLWSTSWVLIKFGLGNIPALTFAGLRYTLAFVCLLPFALQPAQREQVRRITKRDWGSLAWLGVLYYAVAQGTQFLGLAYLPAISASLLLNFTTLAVALLGMAFLSERPQGMQWAGIIIFLGATLLYFYPARFSGREWLGVLIVLVGMLANAISSILGRALNRQHTISPLLVTTLSMGLGALLLLGSGLAFQGLPPLSWQNWLVIAWLAMVNTALAFTLWNASLRQLSAVESSMINNTMLIQIALLAWLFLGEQPGPRQVLALTLAALGGLLVQLRKVR